VFGLNAGLIACAIFLAVLAIFVGAIYLLHLLGPPVGVIDKAIEEQIASEHRLAKHKVHFRWQQRETAIIQRVERRIGKRASPELRAKVVQRFRETHR